MNIGLHPCDVSALCADSFRATGSTLHRRFMIFQNHDNSPDNFEQDGQRRMQQRRGEAESESEGGGNDHECEQYGNEKKHQRM